MGIFGTIGSTLLGGLGAGAAHAGGLFKSPGMKKFDQYTPEQQKRLNEMLQMLSGEGQLGQGQDESLSFWRDILSGEPGAFEKFSDPYMREFNEKTIPMLAERFAGAGANSGALSSSGFGQSLSSAGAGLQSQLAALKAALQQQAAQSIMGQYGQLSGQAFGAQPFGYMQKQPSFGQNLVSGFAQNAPQFAAFL